MFKLIVDYTPSATDNAVLKEGIIEFNAKVLGTRDKEFSVFLKDESGKVFGGILAFVDTESIYIDTLWIEEEIRKQGYGSKLLDLAEQEAIKQGCLFSTLDTWDFQAEGFYLKHGYERLGEVKNFWLGHSKITLRKKFKAI